MIELGMVDIVGDGARVPEHGLLPGAVADDQGRSYAVEKHRIRWQHSFLWKEDLRISNLKSQSLRLEIGHRKSYRAVLPSVDGFTSLSSRLMTSREERPSPWALKLVTMR